MPTNKKSDATSKAETGKSSSTLSGPKTPVQVKGGLKTSAAGKGRSRKTKGKENQKDVDSPLGEGTNTSNLAPSSDPPTREDGHTTVAEKNCVLREHLAAAECELNVSTFR